MTSKKSPSLAPAVPRDQQWGITRVASCLNLSYQTARNRMLSGIYGPSDYDPATKKLTVSASAVRQEKERKLAAQARRKRRQKRDENRAK